MLVARKEVINYISKLIDGLYGKSDEFVKQSIEYAREKYNIPYDVLSDYLTRRKALEEASEFLLFCLLDAIEHTINRSSKIDKLFTKREIKLYSKNKYENPTITLPIIFDMYQVAEDQWIGTITAKMLMQLRDEQLINYNPNTQRTLTRVTTNGVEHWKISINKNAVDEIEEAYLENRFVPNTITLNMPEDTDFVYNEQEHALVINEISHFDIIDGYHRYLGLSNASTVNENFDYPMELRITLYSVEKARQFIFQDDKKTKMSKLDSESFDQYKFSNMVVTRLNESSSCDLHNLINTNSGIIDPAVLSNIINLLYFDKHSDMKTVLSVTNTLRKSLNEFIEQNINLLQAPWKREFTIATIFCLHSDVYDIEKVEEIAEILKKGRYNPVLLSKRDISRLKAELVEE